MTAREQQEEFEILAFRFMGPIYDRAIRSTSNAALADDLVQNTYLQAFHRFHECDRGTDLFNWLLEILETVQEEVCV